MKKFFAVLFAFWALAFFCVPATFGQNAGAKSAVNDFSVTTLDGKTYDTANLRGKIIVVNLWFIGCPNCLEEIKALNRLVEDYQNKDVVFLGLANNKAAPLKNFLQKNPFKYQIVPEATLLALEKFGTPDKNGQINIPYPMHIVIDREGKKVVSVYGVKGVEAVRNELKSQFGIKKGGA